MSRGTRRALVWLGTIVLFCAVFSGCGRERIVKSESFPERAWTDDGTIGCHKSGYCVTCGYDYRLKWHCGPSLRNNCPGVKGATIKHIPARSTYDSGRVQDYTIDLTVESHGACQ